MYVSSLFFSVVVLFKSYPYFPVKMSFRYMGNTRSTHIQIHTCIIMYLDVCGCGSCCMTMYVFTVRFEKKLCLM